MDREGLFAEGDVWESVKIHANEAAARLNTYEEAHQLVKNALKVAGGKHSFLSPVKSYSNSDSTSQILPAISFLRDSILVIKLPSTINLSDNAQKQYINTVLDAFKTYSAAKGIIVDLQDNVGGDFFIMIASLSPLLPDGRVLNFKGRRNVFIAPISLNRILKSTGDIRRNRLVVGGKPVALLVNGKTASAAEATILAFKGIDNVKVFGSPTAGYTSYNVTVPLSDGYHMALTIGNYIARTGDSYCNEAIIPDVETINPYGESMSWLAGY